MGVMRLSILVLLGLVAVIGIWAWAPDIAREKLTRKYFLPSSAMKTLAGAPVHVAIDGPSEGPVVVMIHGFGASLHTWQGWSEGLRDRYRVVRFDLPGAGLSPPDPTGRYDDARAIEIIEALLAELEAPQATLVGNSLGGRIAWRFALERPERTIGLVLVSPDGFASAGFEYGAAPRVSFVWSLMRFFLPKSVVTENLKASYGDPSRLVPEVADRYYELLRAPGARKALLERTRQTILVDPKPLLPSITAPTLLLWGEKDRLIPIENAQDYVTGIPDAEFISFPELGHVPMEEDPETSLAPLAMFLEDIKPLRAAPSGIR